MKASDAQVLCTKETPQGWTPSKYSLEDQQQYKDLFATMPFDPDLHAFFLEEKKRETKERNEATRHSAPWPKEEIPDTSVPSCLDTVLEKEMQQEVCNLLNTVPQKNSKRLVDHVIGKKTYKEIAAEEGLATTTIRNSVQSTKKRLRKNYIKMSKTKINCCDERRLLF